MAPSSEPSELWSAALNQHRRALARCISIVEDDRPGAGAMLADAYRMAGSAHIVGVTGSPGVGKSTLTDRLIADARRAHRLVGVVAVDPSSPFTGGAILGDRIRMQEHVSDPSVFVRSMSSRGRLGGLANGTAKVVTILDAAGFDPVFVETVGVGQNEVEVMEIADTVIVVVTPGMGDGIQAAKAGLLEVGDIFVVNQADRPGADAVMKDLALMLELGTPGEWVPPIISCVATTGESIPDVADAIRDHQLHLQSGQRMEKQRADQAEAMVRRAVLARLSVRVENELVAGDLLAGVLSRTIDPWEAAERLAQQNH